MAKRLSKRVLVLIFGALISSSILAQDNSSEDKTKVSFFGYVSYEAIFDSHRSVYTRDGELYLFPSAPVYHEGTGELLNKNPQLNMLSLQSRLGAKVAGPDVLGAKLSGLVEADFFGTAEEYKHHIRVRHAMMKLQWDKLSLTMGQFWHPMFTPEVFPKVVAFGAAAPFNPLNRSPQVRVDYSPSTSLKLVFAALSHGYHFSSGPEAAQKNSGLPDVQFQIHIGNNPNFNTGFTAGYMWLQPLEQKSGNVVYRSEELIGAFNVQWFGKAKINKLTVQAKATYGENLTQFVMIGGFGRLMADTAKVYDYNYGNINSYAGWLEFIYDINENWNAGLFAGVNGVLGSNDKIDTAGPIFYNRAAKLSRGYRISPRIVYTQSKLSFALEYLYNSADYGASFDDYAKPINITQTVNHRIILGAKYSF